MCAEWHLFAGWPKRANMLTLAMRREREDSASDDYQGLLRQRSRDSDEFVDILQVQQLLLENSGGTNATTGTRRTSRVSQPSASRLLDTIPPGPPYYYGSYGQHTTAPCTNVEDLVAMWFAGSSSAGVFQNSFIIYLPGVIGQWRL